MMYSDKPHRKPNGPIFLEDISITHINGHALDYACLARVTLYLSPTIRCRIESDNLPVSLVNLEQPFSITTIHSCTIKVFLRYNLNNFFSSEAKEVFKGFLVPYKSPCTVINRDNQIQSISFSVLNFPEFYGYKDKWIDLDGTNCRLGAVELEHENLRIELTEDPAFSENKKSLNRDDGYAITHTGLIQLHNDKTLSVKDAERILRGVRAFLTFACGSACGITLVKAIDQNDRERVLEWGTSHTEPWVQRGTTWLPIIDGGDSLSYLFPGFWSLYNNPDWKDTITTVIDWYANCNNSPFHIGVILAQVALEALANKIVGKRVRGAGEWFRRLLTDCGIDEKIPDSCNGLKQLSNTLKNGEENEQIGNGPGVLTKIRNDLVHSEKKCDHISAEAQMEAQKLGCWYIELIMLKKFEYHGRYKNRLKVTDEDPYENVPWSILTTGWKP